MKIKEWSFTRVFLVIMGLLAIIGIITTPEHHTEHKHHIKPELIQELRDNAYHFGYLSGASNALKGNIVTDRESIIKKFRDL